MLRVRTFVSACLPVMLLGASALAQRPLHVFTPTSSLPQQSQNASGPTAVRTHLRLLIPSVAQKSFGAAKSQQRGLPPFPSYFFETPASIACVYGLVEPTRGCNPNMVTAVPTGGSRAIALVDAYDDPTAEADIEAFSSMFGLAPANLQVVYAQGSEPALDPTGGWELEEALDTQWAHAMAPAAKIFLVETADNSWTNLLQGVQIASQLVAKAGGGEVSMSWGGSEFVGENTFDSSFTTPKVVYLASAGDTPGPEYPSVSPNVVSAGGTTNSRNPYTGNLIAQNTWQDAGGGTSEIEPRPAFQNSVARMVGAYRGTPDVSFDANPNTGLWVYNTNAVYGAGWFVVGGTSASAPALAGIVNLQGKFFPNSQAQNAAFYAARGNQMNDVFYGDCGIDVGYLAMPGYDLCTGVGTIQGMPQR
ncbi:MAG: peptidase S8/S53 subtilisin kexin sedolisin [Acidobacteriota bacterium]